MGFSAKHKRKILWMANTPLTYLAAECRSDFSYGKVAIRLNSEQTAGLPCRENPASINT